MTGLILAFHLLSAVLSLAAAGVLAAKLIQFPESFDQIERYGMGLAGGGLILRVGPLLAKPYVSPFDDWSPILLSLGILMTTWGRYRRLLRHARNNSIAVDAAREHFAGKQ